MALSPMAPGWRAVADILKKDGYKVSVAQPPETSYADDQKYTKAAIEAMGGPVVLVGHSYGGSIITEAGNHPNVAALVYIAAFALDEGESCASIEQALPQASKAFGKPDSNGLWWIDEAHFAADFAADESFHGMRRSSWLFRKCRSLPTRSPIRLRTPPGSTNPPGTWSPPKTGRSIRIRERMMAKRATSQDGRSEEGESHVAYMSYPKGNGQAHRGGCRTSAEAKSVGWSHKGVVERSSRPPPERGPLELDLRRS